MNRLPYRERQFQYQTHHSQRKETDERYQASAEKKVTAVFSIEIIGWLEGNKRTFSFYLETKKAKACHWNTEKLIIDLEEDFGSYMTEESDS